MTTALRIHCRTACVILACLAFSSNALAAEPGGIKIQGLLSDSASAPMRDASAKCEEGDDAAAVDDDAAAAAPPTASAAS
jgi:hypothetical protein